VICVYEAIPLTYIHNVIDRNANRELLAEDDWRWLKKTAVQANRLEVTSSGLRLANQEPAEQISLTPQGRVKLLSRERELPSDRCLVSFDVFQGVLPRRLKLPPPQKAFLTEVAISSRLELLDKEKDAYR
jgi:hypothetical protein